MDQVIACARIELRVAVVAPPMEAMPTPEPPDWLEIESTAPWLLSLTLRNCESVEAEPVHLVAASAVRRSNVSF